MRGTPLSAQSTQREKRFDILVLLVSKWPVFLGFAVITLPTWGYITLEDWSTEQGSHSPLVLASGLWLLVRLLPEALEVSRRPSFVLGGLAVALTAIAMLLFRVAAIIELEVYALYALFVAILYSYMGREALKVIWFPLFYLLFAVPLPQSLVALLTNPLKLAISESAVTILHAVGYPIANAGVVILVGQYELLVATACAGLNSLITLTVLTLFYVYLIHRAEWRYMAALTVLVIPIAIFSNLVRVLILILLTYHAGEAAAQGFLHNFAGITTFVIALASIYIVDKVGLRLRKLWGKATHQSSSPGQLSNGLSTK